MSRARVTSRHNGQETAASAAARSKLAILRLNASGNKAVELEREILQAGTSRPRTVGMPTAFP